MNFEKILKDFAPSIVAAAILVFGQMQINTFATGNIWMLLGIDFAVIYGVAWLSKKFM